MTNTNDQHPICIMCDSSKELQQQALSVSQNANAHADCTRQAIVDIANLDIEGAFKKLHQMVAIVGGKPKHARPAQEPAQEYVPLAMAAE